MDYGSSVAHLLGAEELTVSFPTQDVLRGVTIGIAQGDRIGIVGGNGQGKTTLARLLAGQMQPDSGQVVPRRGLRIGYLAQADPADPNLTVGQALVGDRPEHEWAGQPQIRSVISGLVADLPWDRTLGELSGGQLRRVALASLLIEDWDLLILDEPTNHLDLQGIAWLANHLKQRWPRGTGGLLVITHDRWFLDEVATTTWEVHSGGVEPFEGGYAAYILASVERDRRAAAAEAKRQNLLRKELAWLRRGAPARTAKPKFRLDAAAELISDVPPPRDSLELQALATARLGKRVVDLVDVGFSYGDTPVLEDVNWLIAPGERAAVLGANGAGKSTLLKLIAGQLDPTEGRVKRGKTVQLAVLDQQFTALKKIGDQRVREVLARTKTTFNVDGRDMTPAQLLERLGFKTAQLSSPVADLSGGQKRRLQLLLLLLESPNVLILDEPTNDVDTEMLSALEDLLDTWPGTLIVVSHDRYLIERVTDQQYAILDGTLRDVPGGIDQYLQLAAAEQRDRQAASDPASDRADGGDNVGGEGERAQGPSGAQWHAIRRRLGSLERALDKQVRSLERMHEEMAACDPSDFARLQELSDKANAQQAKVDALEEEWLELSEQVD